MDIQLYRLRQGAELAREAQRFHRVRRGGVGVPHPRPGDLARACGARRHLRRRARLGLDKGGPRRLSIGGDRLHHRVCVAWRSDVFITSSAALAVTKSGGARRFIGTSGYSTSAIASHSTCVPGCYFPCYASCNTRTRRQPPIEFAMPLKDDKGRSDTYHDDEPLLYRYHTISLHQLQRSVTSMFSCT